MFHTKSAVTLSEGNSRVAANRPRPSRTISTFSSDIAHAVSLKGELSEGCF